MSTTRKLYRVKDNKMVFGVSTGLSEYLGIDVSIVRIIFVILALTGVGFPILVYIVLGIVLPVKEDEIEKAETVDEYAYNKDDYKY